jgi:putative aldouronate transport system permease protein
MKVKLNRLPTYLNYLFFVFLAIIMVYPLWYVLMFSLSDPDRISINNYYLIPDGFTLRTYSYVIKSSYIRLGFKNSLFVTGIGTLLSVLLTTITGYPLSRKELFGKKYIFSMMLFTMLFSGGLIPTYLVVRAFGLVDSLWALILPNVISVFNMMIAIKFFKNIPDSLIESAKIDGYNDVYIFVRIVMPLSTAVIATIGLFYAVSYWNTYLYGVIYITSMEKRVLQVVIRSMLYEETLAPSVGIRGEMVTPESMKMAAIFVTLLPILCVYPFLQKYFMKGILLGAVKG